jgi:hypothetical protein
VNLVPGHFYVSGNYVHDYPDVTADNWKGIHPDENTEAMKASIKSDTRFIPSGYEGQTLITTHTAEKAFGKVLSYVGASFRRDALDERITKETHDGTTTYNGSKGSYSTDKYQGIIDSPNDVGGWPTLEEYDKQTDTDQDGIPDAWETVNNLNPNDASDGNKYTIDSKNWYTNLEVYANSLVEDIVKAGNAEAESAIEEYYPAYKTPTGISTVRTTAISATEYYDLNGRRLAEPQRGVSIRVERLSNGQSITSKVIK